ncbi:hypothetical protein D187_009002 [Cystobacter fuscus DSM 2262]|uniref:Uncharacterized protein n=1 Tax=Cystobacter fuscus (strain ATCC 25194 / DSM 2262 / NBRC 100088 / M29) TaxID=1242864 RepID=S9NWV2_CYSF2|nr:hypothetical protein [Cystobacter fuscus]EPX55391.1 hypothetical protein D187_009002 [Cystobacter fuscus DSM 2262]
MGTFKQFLDAQQLEPRTLVRLSSQLEARSDADRKLVKQRSDKRRDKEKQARPYAELGIGKPKSGRGVSEQQVTAALEDKPLPPKVRGKLVRAVNAVLSKKGGAAVTFQALFGEVSAQKGAAAKAKAS